MTFNTYMQDLWFFCHIFYFFSFFFRLNSSPSSGSVSPFSLTQDKCQQSHTPASNNVNTNAHGSVSPSETCCVTSDPWWRNCCHFSDCRVHCCSWSVGAKWRGHGGDARKIQLWERATGSRVLGRGNTDGYFNAIYLLSWWKLPTYLLRLSLLQLTCPQGRIPSWIWTVWLDQVLTV